VYALPVDADGRAHVGVPDITMRRRRDGVECHVCAPDTKVVTVNGVRVAAPAYVFIQLAATFPLVELVVQGDALVRKGLLSPEELVATCEASSEKHAGRASRAARFVRAGVDSPMETRLRMLLVLAGLPEPVVNYCMYDKQGRLRRRFDLCYPGVRVIIEYDGRQHAEDSVQWTSDIRRREELDHDGWRIVVVTADGIYKHPEETLQRVRTALRDRRMKDLPPRFRRTWRAHFPGREALAS